MLLMATIRHTEATGSHSVSRCCQRYSRATMQRRREQGNHCVKERQTVGRGCVLMADKSKIDTQTHTLTGMLTQTMWR